MRRKSCLTRIFALGGLFASVHAFALPNLAVTDIVSAEHDPYRLQFATGAVVFASLKNSGTSATDGEIRLLAFIDENRNGRQDADTDALLGETTVAPLAAGAEQVVAIPVTGTLPFRDAENSVHAVPDPAETEWADNWATSSDSCKINVFERPEPMEPVVKWHWDGAQTAIAPSHKQVMSTPMVGPLEDTNGDGLFDHRDTPSVVFLTFAGHYYGNNGVLRALNGETGEELWAVADQNLYPGSNPALADIDLDGALEIVVTRVDGGLLALDHTGAIQWRSDHGDNPYGGVTIANLLTDTATPEILVNDWIVDGRDGSLIRQCDGHANSDRDYGNIPVAADVNLDGKLEVILGGSVCDPETGESLWKSTVAGYAAVVNLFGDDYPEIIVSYQNVWVYEHRLDGEGKDTWRLAWARPIPGGGRGGPPTVADLDHDGEPEIGVAGAYRYAAFNSDGSLLWSQVTEDSSSNITGSSVFDFNADGKAEVVYADQRYLRVYNGEDGSVIYQIPNPSGTLTEMPVVVDVDNDGHAEIVVASNHYAFPGANGIRVFEDQQDNWANTRKIWNQHGYHIGNIHEDGSVPSLQPRSWETHNTFRLNTYPDQREAQGVGMPDLTVGFPRQAKDGGGAFWVRVGNAGRADSGAATMTLHQADGSVAQTEPLAGLAGGEYREIRLSNPASTAAEWYVSVDYAEQITECREDNNRIALSSFETDTGYAVFGQILDDLGQPMAGVTVEVGGQTAITDALGNWRIHGLLGDWEYPVKASKEGVLFAPLTHVTGNRAYDVALRLQPVSDLKMVARPHVERHLHQGEALTYYLSILNGGHSTATGLKLESVLPEGATLVEIQGAANGARGMLLPDLPAGESRELAITMATDEVNGRIVTHWTLQSNEYPPRAISSAKYVNPHLFVKGDTTPGTVVMNRQVRHDFTIALSPYSPVPAATDVVFEAELSDNVTLIQVWSDQGNCDVTDPAPKIRCTLKDLSIVRADAIHKATVFVDVRLDDPALLVTAMQGRVRGILGGEEVSHTRVTAANIHWAM